MLIYQASSGIKKLDKHNICVILRGMKLLTTKQAGERLKVNDSRVRQLILAGRLPAQKFGSAWMIKEKDLAKVADRKTGRPGWLKKGK